MNDTEILERVRARLTTTDAHTRQWWITQLNAILPSEQPAPSPEPSEQKSAVLPESIIRHMWHWPQYVVESVRDVLVDRSKPYPFDSGARSFLQDLLNSAHTAEDISYALRSIQNLLQAKELKVPALLFDQDACEMMLVKNCYPVIHEEGGWKWVPCPENSVWTGQVSVVRSVYTIHLQLRTLHNVCLFRYLNITPPAGVDGVVVLTHRFENTRSFRFVYEQWKRHTPYLVDSEELQSPDLDYAPRYDVLTVDDPDNTFRGMLDRQIKRSTLISLVKRFTIPNTLPITHQPREFLATLMSLHRPMVEVNDGLFGSLAENHTKVEGAMIKGFIQTANSSQVSSQVELSFGLLVCNQFGEWLQEYRSMSLVSSVSPQTFRSRFELVTQLDSEWYQLDYQDAELINVTKLHTLSMLYDDLNLHDHARLFKDSDQFHYDFRHAVWESQRRPPVPSVFPEEFDAERDAQQMITYDEMPVLTKKKADGTGALMWAWIKRDHNRVKTPLVGTFRSYIQEKDLYVTWNAQFHYIWENEFMLEYESTRVHSAEKQVSVRMIVHLADTNTWYNLSYRSVNTSRVLRLVGVMELLRSHSELRRLLHDRLTIDDRLGILSNSTYDSSAPTVPFKGEILNPTYVPNQSALERVDELNMYKYSLEHLRLRSNWLSGIRKPEMDGQHQFWQSTDIKALVERGFDSMRSASQLMMAVWTSRQVLEQHNIWIPSKFPTVNNQHMETLFKWSVLTITPTGENLPIWRWREWKAEGVAKLTVHRRLGELGVQVHSSDNQLLLMYCSDERKVRLGQKLYVRDGERWFKVIYCDDYLNSVSECTSSMDDIIHSTSQWTDSGTVDSSTLDSGSSVPLDQNLSLWHMHRVLNCWSASVLGTVLEELILNNRMILLVPKRSEVPNGDPPVPALKLIQKVRWSWNATEAVSRWCKVIGGILETHKYNLVSDVPVLLDVGENKKLRVVRDIVGLSMYEVVKEGDVVDVQYPIQVTEVSHWDMCRTEIKLTVRGTPFVLHYQDQVLRLMELDCSG